MNALRTWSIGAAWSAAILFSALVVHGQAPATGSSSQEAFDAAVKLYQDGKWTEALSAFQKFEQSWKLSDAVPSAVYYQGWCWFNLQKYAESASVLERLIKSFPKTSVIPEAMLKQAECYRELKDYTKAAALYRAFQQNYPKHALLPHAMIGEASMFQRQKDNRKAESIVRGVLSQFSDDPVATLDGLFLLGQIYNEEKNYDKAREIYKQISRSRDPRATEGLFLQAETMYDAKRYEDAIAYYVRVQSKAGLLGTIQAQMDALSKQAPVLVAGGTSPAIIKARMDSLRQLFDQTKQRPDLRASALFRVANCYQSLGKPEEASVVYRHFLRLFPDDKLAEQAHYGLIQALTERKQLDQANLETESFKRKYPSSKLLEGAVFMQAESLFGTDQFQDALDKYKEYLKTSKDAELIESASYRIGACQYGLKQFEQARDTLAGFIQKYPKSRWMPDALFRLGRSYFDLSQKATDPKAIQDNLAKAADAFEKIRTAYSDTPGLPEVIFQLGYLYGFLGRFDKTKFQNAVDAFQDFTNRWPDYKDKSGKPLAPEALYQVAHNDLALGKNDEAVAAYNQIVAKYPDTDLAPYAAYEIATVYAGAKKSAEMIAAIRAYAQKYPSHKSVGDALYAVGQELENQKKPDDAIAEYRGLIALAEASADDPPENVHNASIAAQIRIAALLEAQSKVDDAVADCEKFLAKFGKDPVAARAMINQIAGLYRRAKRFADAYAKLELLGSKYQQNPAVRVAAASGATEIALTDKDLPRANTFAQKLLADPEKDRLPAASYIAVGNTLLKTDKFAQARDVFEKSLSMYPNDARTAPATLLGLGQAQLGLGNLDQAESAFNKMIAADPQGPALPDAKLGLAKVYEARNKQIEAFDLYNWVMQNARGDAAAEAAFRAGSMRLAAKDYKLALPYFLRVQLTAAGPMGEESSFRAAQCHEGLGNVDAARNAYQAYLKRFPNGKFVEDAKIQLAALPAPKPEVQP